MPSARHRLTLRLRTFCRNAHLLAVDCATMYNELLSTEKVRLRVSADDDATKTRPPLGHAPFCHPSPSTPPPPHPSPSQVNIMRDIFKLVDAHGSAFPSEEAAQRSVGKTMDKLHHQLQNLQLRANSDARLELSQTEAIRQIISDRCEAEQATAPINDGSRGCAMVVLLPSSFLLLWPSPAQGCAHQTAP